MITALSALPTDVKGLALSHYSSGADAGFLDAGLGTYLAHDDLSLCVSLLFE